MIWTRRRPSSTPPSRWRRVQRIALQLLVGVVLALSLAAGHDAAMTPAGALFDKCKPDAPAPHDPRDGAAGMVAQQPEQLSPGDPFTAGTSSSSLFAKYGTAGLWWPTYDPGCNPATEASMTIGTSIGDWGQQVSNFFQNATAAARSWAWRNDWLAPLDRTVANFNKSLMGNYTGPLLGLGLVVAGLFIVHRGRRAELSESASHALWGIGVVVLGVCALSAPTRLGNMVDYYGVGSAGAVERAMGGQDISHPPRQLTIATAHPNTCEGMGGVTGCFDASAQQKGVLLPDQLARVQSSDDPLVGLVNRDVAYRQWLIGMFGSADSATALRFGPRFYEAMALSWEDVRKPPAQLEKIKERKMARFKDLAGKLHDADHDAYRVMQGKTAFSDRVVTGWLTALMAGIATLFAAIAGVAVLLARLMIRGGVMALPIIVPFGLIRTHRGAVTALFKMIATAIVTAIMFTIASGLMTRLTTALLESNVPTVLSLALLIAVTVAALKKLRAGLVIATLAGVTAGRWHRSHASDSAKQSATDAAAEQDIAGRRRVESEPVGMPPPFSGAAGAYGGWAGARGAKPPPSQHEREPVTATYVRSGATSASTSTGAGVNGRLTAIAATSAARHQQKKGAPALPAGPAVKPFGPGVIETTGAEISPRSSHGSELVEAGERQRPMIPAMAVTHVVPELPALAADPDAPQQEREAQQADGPRSAGLDAHGAYLGHPTSVSVLPMMNDASEEPVFVPERDRSGNVAPGQAVDVEASAPVVLDEHKSLDELGRDVVPEFWAGPVHELPASSVVERAESYSSQTASAA